ncbi:MAG: hypothetical protein COB49_01965 [Alphaproteobacteria bacterium]|nr:MAG: hypothetical protein COB49_01965 [Alphaproteobacteria bacterium]
MRRFAFRLAALLGCTVRELLARIDARELAEWQAYYRLEPFGEERADWRTAQTTAMIANVNLGKDARPIEAGIFMYGYQPEPEPSLADQIKAVFGGMKKDI